MKILVAYYTRDGHTRQVAQRIAESFGADLDEVVDTKKRNSILGFLIAGYDATRGKTTEILFEKDPADYDLVIVGTPIWNGRVTPAIRTYLLTNREKIKKAAFFATYAAGGGICLEQMSKIYNKEIITYNLIRRKKLEDETNHFIETLKKFL